MNNQNCKTCKYVACNEFQDHVCINSESEYYSDFVEPDHSCIDYVSKETD